MELTVLMPVYNGEKYLREAIDSVLSQSFKEFEFLIINDGSTDKSKEIILSYADERIKYVENEHNIKLISTLNKGINIATGKYIVRMDADDICYPQRLEKQYTFMEQYQQVAICGSWFESFGAQNSLVKYVEKHQEIMFKMLYQCHLCHPSLILRKSALTSFDVMFDPAFAHAEDYDFFVRIGQKYQLANLQEVLLKYRIHSDSVSARHKEVQKDNSNIIKIRLFSQLGYSITNKELINYEMLNTQDYNNISLSAQEVKGLLEGVCNANAQTKFFDQIFFKERLQGFWFNYCYNTSTISMYSNSKLLAMPLPFTTYLKWNLKRILFR